VRAGCQPVSVCSVSRRLRCSSARRGRDEERAGFRACSAWLGPKVVARWLRDTWVNMTEDKVELAERAAKTYNRRDIDTFFAELATPDLVELAAWRW